MQSPGFIRRVGKFLFHCGIGRSLARFLIVSKVDEIIFQFKSLGYAGWN